MRPETKPVSTDIQSSLSEESIASKRRTSKLPAAALAGCVAIALMGAMLFIGFGVGVGVGRYTAYEGPRWSESVTNTATLYDCRRRPEKGAAGLLFPEFGLFWEAMDLLYEEYFGVLPDSEEVAYQAIRSVIGLLDDPNTSLLTPDEAAYYRTNIQGAFEGIGARVGWDEEANTLVIVEPFESQPAWQAGLRRDDLIYAVDGVSIVGLGVTEAVNVIRGPKGSVVTLTVLRPGETDTFEVDVVRDSIDIPTLRTEAMGADGEIAYIRLSSFNENAGQLTKQAIEDAVSRNAEAIILDLRGNSGGLLREAVTISSLFLDDKIVLYEQFSDGRQEIYRTEGRPVSTDLPVVVLVNEASASASEIVAGALQDHDRATLIGTTTFGKGSVQLPFTLSNDGIMRITIARWLTPDRRSISDTGLAPDIVVEQNVNADDEGQFETNSSIDPQLDAAIEFITQSLDGN